jgi:hypothetical protein
MGRVRSLAALVVVAASSGCAAQGGRAPPPPPPSRIVGPSADHPSLAGQPWVHGGLIVRLPVSDGTEKPAATDRAAKKKVAVKMRGSVSAVGSGPTRDVLVYFCWTGPNAQGRFVAVRAEIPISEPREIRFLREDPEDPEIGPEALRRVRARCPFHAKQPVQLDGRPAWVIVSPMWTAKELDPDELRAEVYQSDPDGGGLPVAVVKIADFDPTGLQLREPDLGMTAAPTKRSSAWSAPTLRSRSSS